MSKKHKKSGIQNPTPTVQAQATGFTQQAEFGVIKSDLIKVLVLNLIYLIAIISLYYFNQKSNVLNSWFTHWLHI